MLEEVGDRREVVVEVSLIHCPAPGCLHFPTLYPIYNTTQQLHLLTLLTCTFHFCLLEEDVISLLHNPLPANPHSPHLLPTGKQTVCPNPTNNLLTSCHFSLGNHPSSAILVSSGFFVRCHPHRFVMRCTCTSTPMPSCRFQAALMQR